MPLTPQSREYENKLAAKRKKAQQQAEIARLRSEQSKSRFKGNAKPVESFSQPAPKNLLQRYKSLSTKTNTDFADTNLISFVEPFAKVLAGTVGGGLNAASKGQEMAYKALGVPKGFGASETLIPRNEKADNTILSSILSRLPVSSSAKQKAKKGFTSDVSWSALPLAALNAIPIGGGGGGAAVGSVAKNKTVKNEVLDLADDVFDPVKKAADEAAKEVENIPRILGDVEDVIPTGNRIVNSLKFDDATWEAAYDALQNKTNPTDPNVGAAMLAILNYGPDALRQIDEPIVQRLSSVVEGGVIPKFEWANTPSQLEQRVANTMADVSRIFDPPKSTDTNFNFLDILRNNLSRLGGSNEVSPDYQSPVFDVARRLADLEDIPTKINAAIPRGGIFTFPIDHNPFGLGAIRETGTRAVNERLIKAEDAAKGVVDLVKTLRSSGIAIPPELNKLLGTDARWSFDLPAWRRAYEKLPNLSDAWIDAGLLDEYASNAKRLGNVSDEASALIEFYLRYANDPEWLKIINSR
jgi:hypothetical protein